MWKWIIIYWVTVESYNLVLVKQYDTRCQCFVEPDYKPEIRTDTARAEFKTKKAALNFIKNNHDFTGWRLDSLKK